MENYYMNVWLFWVQNALTSTIVGPQGESINTCMMLGYWLRLSHLNCAEELSRTGLVCYLGKTSSASLFTTTALLSWETSVSQGNIRDLKKASERKRDLSPWETLGSLWWSKRGSVVLWRSSSGKTEVMFGGKWPLAPWWKRTTVEMEMKTEASEHSHPPTTAMICGGDAKTEAEKHGAALRHTHMLQWCCQCSQGPHDQLHLASNTQIFLSSSILWKTRKKKKKLMVSIKIWDTNTGLGTV